MTTAAWPSPTHPTERRVLALSGRLDSASVTTLWESVRRAAVADAKARRVVVDARRRRLLRRRRHRAAGRPPAPSARREGRDRQPRADVRDAAQAVRPDAYSSTTSIREPSARAGGRGDRARGARRSGATFAARSRSSARLTSALVYAMRNPASVRWRDVWRICERVGADALPIVALISFLLGMILAFQSAVPMKRFGAEIFVADLIGLSMLRELGPLMTAILLAGRSGAAFAAEIGTMTRQPGGRRADHDGPRPGALPGDAADHRRAADDAAARRCSPIWSG